MLNCRCVFAMISNSYTIWEKTEAVKFTELKFQPSSNNVNKTLLLRSSPAVADCGVAPVELLTGNIKT